MTNALNTLMFGSERDKLWLGEYTPELSALVAGLDIDADIPDGLIDLGWINDEGANLGFSDSVEKIRGHQGNGVVRTYMSESDTSFEAAGLEAKFGLLKWILDSVVTRETSARGTVYGRFAQKASRRIKRLVGVWDAYDTTSGDHVRLVFPVLELGARDAIPFKVKNIQAFKFTLEVLGDWFDLSDAPGLVPDAPSGPAPTISGVTPSGAEAGDTITIAGANLTGATSVTVGGAAAANVTVVSASSVTARVPAGSAGSAPVVVTTPNGSSAPYSYTRG